MIIAEIQRLCARMGRLEAEMKQIEAQADRATVDDREALASEWGKKSSLYDELFKRFEALAEQARVNGDQGMTP